MQHQLAVASGGDNLRDLRFLIVGQNQHIETQGRIRLLGARELKSYPKQSQLRRGRAFDQQPGQNGNAVQRKCDSSSSAYDRMQCERSYEHSSESVCEISFQ